MNLFPSLFVTHGAPTLAIEDGSAHRFLKGYGASLSRTHAVRNPPTEEHLLPLFTAIGASRPSAGGQRVHHSYTYGVLAMDTNTNPR